MDQIEVLAITEGVKVAAQASSRQRFLQGKKAFDAKDRVVQIAFSFAVHETTCLVPLRSKEISY